MSFEQEMHIDKKEGKLKKTITTQSFPYLPYR